MPTMGDPLRHAVRSYGSRTAVIDGERSFTFAELGQRIARLAGALDALGCARGERVAILAGNGHRYIETYVGVPASGRVVVPLNTRHAEAELRYALTDAGTTLLITDRDPDQLRDCAERVWTLEDFDAALDAAAPAELPRDLAPDDLAGLFYTGGTTGKSKGVMLSHRNLIANTYHWLAMVPHEPGDVELVMAPLFHAAGSNGVLGAIWKGTVQVTLGAFDPAAALDLIARHEVTHTLGVPAMLAAMGELQHQEPRQTASLRFLSHGGSPVATEVVRRVSAALPTAELVEVYGATELSPLATVLRHEQQRVDRPEGRSCGQMVPGVDIQIVSDSGEACAPGAVGEVVVRGDSVMLGYWNKPEQTADVLADGAYRTGDLGYLDDAGYLYLVDRSKDMIVSGGENVYSIEVEEALYRHPAVLEAAVFGVPDDRWGEAVHAVVVPRGGHEAVAAETLIAHCRELIAGYKVPKGIDFRAEALPKSGPGKVLKRELRAPFWKGQERSVN
ncbi:MAG: AMP-binding protein [Pseudomonadota bacterium]